MYDLIPSNVEKKIKTGILILFTFEIIGFSGISFADAVTNPSCKSGPSPEDNFVFFDCKWVEVPSHWTYENGLWQENPSVMKLGPQPTALCPEIDVCTCSGKFFHYNNTDKQCYSSPYVPTFNQNACKEYTQFDFAGWDFNEHLCEWISLSNPYHDDESLRLASEKIEVGGLGIDPVFNENVIIVGIVIGSGLLIGLTVYWRKRK